MVERETDLGEGGEQSVNIVNMEKRAITKKTIVEVFDMYPYLGKIHRLSRFRQSTENEIFKVGTTKNKPVVLKFYVFERREDSEIMFELSFIDFLRSRGIHAVNFYENCLNQAITHFDLPQEKQRQVVIYEYIEGKIVQKPNDSQIKSIFEVLGEMHRASKHYKTNLAKRVWTVLDNCQEMETEMPSLLKLLCLPRGEAEAVIGYLSDNFRRAQKAESELEKKFVVHGDLYQSNIKFKGNNISGILDFDECGYGSFLQDIGVVLAELYSPDITFQELLSVFLEIYQKYNPINPSEIKLIPTMMNLRYAQMLYWTLRHKSRGIPVPQWKEESLRAIVNIKRIKDLERQVNI